MTPPIIAHAIITRADRFIKDAWVVEPSWFTSRVSLQLHMPQCEAASTPNNLSIETGKAATSLFAWLVLSLSLHHLLGATQRNWTHTLAKYSDTDDKPFLLECAISIVSRRWSSLRHVVSLHLRCIPAARRSPGGLATQEPLHIGETSAIIRLPCAQARPLRLPLGEALWAGSGRCTVAETH